MLRGDAWSDRGALRHGLAHAARACFVEVGKNRAMREPWNVNIHYDAQLDASVSVDASSVLDVGCGDGFLAARLSRRIPRVVALDIDGSRAGQDALR